MHRKTMQLFGEDYVVAKYGVAPHQLCDMRSLVGDKSVCFSILNDCGANIDA